MVGLTSEVVYDGKVFKLEYENADSFESLPAEQCTQVYGVCFYGGKLVLGGHKDHFNLLGGTIEKGESFEETLRREVQEESNMKVLKFAPIGYQKVIPEEGEVYYQLRYVCEVAPIGDFEKDPGGSVTEIKLVEPSEYKKYFNWGEIGDRIMERALELKKRLA